MACTGAGIISILILFIAVVLNVVSFILPMWSTSEVVNGSLKDDVTKADFAAGIWGYCTDVELTKNKSGNESVAFDHCYFFHTSNDYDVSELNATWAKDFASFSVCEGYEKADSIGSVALSAYAGGLAIAAGMDAGQFEVFLKRSCSALGSATIVFASFAASTGVLAFIGLVLGVTCCKNRSSFNVAVKVLISFAFVSTFLTFILWLFQSHPLGKEDDVGLSGSFIISVLSAILFFISGGLLARHSKMTS
ncbi:hypothetical protein Poli38472_014004 [Pythium oligandrum]|uniref:Uncharacterized protein n=1 Tax=Pythium oligandrum TaxID=41045 RepID=A0A8K1FP96_PYTOL|nr:hypothetical protein Poli38472_014004 [Pythium oligandrum]|eukprot:TMW66692.1 hypothetical protein Poli38472_014004 [Pythium oligandrum]